MFADLHGNILEIGPGTRPNLRYYPTDVCWTGIEPNAYMYPYLQQEAERVGLDIDIKNGTAERLDVEDKQHR